MTGILVARIAICVSLAVVAAIASWPNGGDGMRAPLLTMAGGFIIIVATFPEKKPTLRELGIVLGTLILVAGSYFWLLDETPDKFEVTFIIVLLYAIIALALIAWFSIWGVIIIREIFFRRNRSSGE